ncbi:MAG: class I SAM-dependent methyltransferase [Methanothrix sp.]|nr:class I SAM-dependent methyltransferase [Methanothrix sp.]
MNTPSRPTIKASTIFCYDRHAQAYDLYQPAVVPGYQEMLDLTAEACRRNLPGAPKLIDLGCGTGNAALAVLQKIPSAGIYLIDGSERMVEVAAEKISRASPEAVLGQRAADLAGSNWDEGLVGESLEGGSLDSEKYDAIISTLVLEHLPFDRYKAAIAKCYRLLKPGGWLLAAEGYAEEGSDMQEWFFEEMECRRKAIDPELSDFVARLRDEKETHYYCSKAEKEEWWRQAGFVQVNVLWQYLCIALMAGRKPF